MKVALSHDQWTAVLTTTTTTVFQNRSLRPIYITSEDTTSLDLDEGIELNGGDAIVFETGKDVSAAISKADGILVYTELA